MSRIAVIVAACLPAVLVPAVAAGSGALPLRLNETGLYAGETAAQTAPGVLPFSPQYPLWSDGATKRRWIALPEGSAVDATDPAAWDFPRGTRLWKEFSTGGRRVETRMIERLQDGEWRYATYVWNDAGTEATLAPTEGIAALPLAGGGSYRIPSEYDCRACHEGAPVPVLGFSALQLSADRDPLAPHAEPRRPGEPDLADLVRKGVLRNLPVDLLETPPRVHAGTELGRAVLGYLHANCGHCHADPSTSDAAVPVELRLALDPRNPAAADAVRQQLLDSRSRYGQGSGIEGRVVVAGHAKDSILLQRMRSRDPRVQMPPLGSAMPDDEALALIERWVNTELTNP